MKRLLILSFFLFPSLAQADRLGSLNTNTQVALSTQCIINQNTLQSGSTFYVSSGTVNGSLNVNGTVSIVSSATESTPLQVNNPAGTLLGSLTSHVFAGNSAPDPVFKYRLTGGNNGLAFQPSTSNSDGALALYPSGTASGSAVVLYSDSAGTIGTPIMAFGGGFAGAPASTWSFGSLVYGAITSNALPLGIQMSNSWAHRFQALLVGNDGKFTMTYGDPDNSNLSNVVRTVNLYRAVGGTGSAGVGESLGFQVDSTIQLRDLAEIQSIWSTATDATRKGRLVLGVHDSGTSAGSPRKNIQLDTDGTNPFTTFTGSATFSGPLISTSVFYTTTSTRPWVSACGTTPSIASYSTNQSGQITVGGGVTSACTLNFATPLWINPPACIFTSNAAIASGTGSSTSSAFTFGGTSITSDIVMYQCSGSY